MEEKFTKVMLGEIDYLTDMVTGIMTKEKDDKDNKRDYTDIHCKRLHYIEGRESEIESIIETVKIKYNVFEISVVHYIGEFYTGDSLFLVAVLGAHRNESLKALTEVIEKVKYDVEFKKEEISKQGKRIILAGG